MQDIFQNLFFQILNFGYGLFADWGLAIIFIAVIVALVAFPFVLKFYHNDASGNKPRLSTEFKQVRWASIVPLALPILVFIPLFSVLRLVSERIGGTYSFMNIIPVLEATPLEMVGSSLLSAFPYILLAILFVGLCAFCIHHWLKSNVTRQKSTYLIVGLAIVAAVALVLVSPSGALLFAVASLSLILLQIALVKKFA